jgi:hypothetical protein
VIDQILLYGNQQMKKIIIIISLMAASLTGAQAALIITEVMSSSGTGGTPDWFEVTNTGTSAVDITDFRFDDGSFNFNASVSLVGVTSIAAGQSVVFLETAAGVGIANFRTFWGGSATTAVIGSYSGSGVGFSSGGDGAAIYDTSENSVAKVQFGAATTGSSFGYDLASYPNQNGFGGSSVNGSNGAFISANALGNIGSPGVAFFPSEVPEPSRLGFLGLSFIILLFTRSRR